MCDMCNSNEVTEAVRNEIDALSDAAIQEIVRMVSEELDAKNDIMIASILAHFDVTQVTLNKENVQQLHNKLSTGALRLEGNASADDRQFTFSLEEGNVDEGVQALMRALGLA